MKVYRVEVPVIKRGPKQHIAKVCRWFWLEAGRREGRLELLRYCATRKIQPTQRYRKLRRRKATKLINATRYACFVCAKRAEVGHHVIQLQHGGTNDVFNIVPICESCHADIHPWLPTEAMTDEHRPLWG